MYLNKIKKPLPITKKQERMRFKKTKKRRIITTQTPI